MTDLLAEALHRLARGNSTDFDAYLYCVERDGLVDETKVSAHCHCVKLDGNGRPRVEGFVEALACSLLDYAIPRKAIHDAQKEDMRTGSSQCVVRLAAKARKLFSDIEMSGEGGELLLFAISEKILGLPQLVCKMELKTNSRMHIHGADGLHAGVNENTGNLVLYFGESKIFRNVSEAIRNCLKSLAPMLLDHQASTNDLHLLERHLDVDDTKLENALKSMLDPDNPQFNTVEFRGLCLVGFDCDAYTKYSATLDIDTVVGAIKKALPSWKKHVAKRVSDEQLVAFSMHFFLVPFPSVDEFRRRFRSSLGFESLPSKAAMETINPLGSSLSPSGSRSATRTKRRDGQYRASVGRPTRKKKTEGVRTRGAS